LLAKDRTRQWLVEALNEVRQKFDVAIFAYVIMPEHLHCLLRPRQREYDMAPIVAAIKKPVSSRAKAHLIETGQARWLERLTVTQGQRTVFRFWLAGGGHDRNLWNDKPIHKTVEYIHMNPVRRGLVTRPEDWEWSSAQFWAGIRPVPLEMDQVR
jgi:putative transposase